MRGIYPKGSQKIPGRLSGLICTTGFQPASELRMETGMMPFLRRQLFPNAR